MATLFDLHRSLRIVRIAAADGRRLADDEVYEGEVITLGLKSPTQAIQARLMEFLAQARDDAEAEAKKTGMLGNLKLNAAQWTTDQMIQLILTLEIGAVQEEADLAPNADGADLTDEQKAELKDVPQEEQREREQAAATKRRQERRKAELQEMDLSKLTELLAELQLRLAILSQATTKFLMAQLCAIIVQPEPPHTQMFTYDEHDINGHRNPNYIGDLQPETMELLGTIRSEFFADLSEQKIRAQATNAGFMKAGRSRNNRRGSRGGIGKTPATFRRALSDSSQNESGSTASTKL